MTALRGSFRSELGGFPGLSRPGALEVRAGGNATPFVIMFDLQPRPAAGDSAVAGRIAY
jgi:hypothetical protein